MVMIQLYLFILLFLLPADNSLLFLQSTGSVL